MLTLTEALRTGRLDEFTAQEKKRGIGPVDKKELDAAIEAVITKPPQSANRTLHSASRDGSNGK
jgi:hypothetical protein